MSGRKTVWNKKPAYSWHLSQSWYHTSVPVQGKYTLCFCKKCNKMSLWHTLGRAISKCWLKSVYLQRAIWSLNSTQSNLQWFWCREAKQLMPQWGMARAKKFTSKDITFLKVYKEYKQICEANNLPLTTTNLSAFLWQCVQGDNTISV